MGARPVDPERHRGGGRGLVHRAGVRPRRRRLAGAPRAARRRRVRRALVAARRARSLRGDVRRGRPPCAAQQGRPRRARLVSRAAGHLRATGPRFARPGRVDRSRCAGPHRSPRPGAGRGRAADRLVPGFGAAVGRAGVRPRRHAPYRDRPGSEQGPLLLGRLPAAAGEVHAAGAAGGVRRDPRSVFDPPQHQQLQEGIFGPLQHRRAHPDGRARGSRGARPAGRAVPVLCPLSGTWRRELRWRGSQPRPRTPRLAAGPTSSEVAS